MTICRKYSSLGVVGEKPFFPSSVTAVHLNTSKYTPRCKSHCHQCSGQSLTWEGRLSLLTLQSLHVLHQKSGADLTYSQPCLSPFFFGHLSLCMQPLRDTGQDKSTQPNQKWLKCLLSQNPLQCGDSRTKSSVTFLLPGTYGPSPQHWAGAGRCPQAGFPPLPAAESSHSFPWRDPCGQGLYMA